VHEVRLLRRVLAAALDRMREAGATRLTGLTVEVHGAGHLTEAAAREQFSVLALGTPAERATLRIAWRPARYRCPACLLRFESVEPADEVECPRCGGPPLAEAGSQGMRLRSIRVETGAAAGVPGRRR
jgi:Zn finger protein HypA/HybF involved in hydrogenase expression